MRCELIVEGDGEVAAAPILLRHFAPSVRVGRPIRVRRQAFVQDTGYRSRYFELARRKGADVVLVILDADDDCPARLGSAALAAWRGEQPDLRIELSLAVREYEAWFLSSADCLGLGQVPQNPEGVRGAKEEIRRRTGRYSPTVDQPSYTAQMLHDCDLAMVFSRAPSLGRLARILEGFEATGP